MPAVLTQNGVDITAWSPLKTWKVRNVGYASIATASYTVEQQSPFTLNIAKEQPVTIVDHTGVTIFKGYSRRVVRKDFNIQGIRKYEVSCQDLTSDLGADVIDNGNRTTSETDQARIIWLINTFSTRGLTAATPGSGGFVQQVYGTNLPPQDFTGMNLAEAIEEVRKISGASSPYVDFNSKVHYFSVETARAPFDIDMQAPNPLAAPRPLRPCRNFSYPDDSVDFVNAVYVIGTTGVATWRYLGGSIPAAGTRRAATIKDDSIADLTQAAAAGDAFLAGQQNLNDGEYETWYPGLRAGQVQHIKNTDYGLDADFPITQVEVDFVSATDAFYKVTFGAAPVTLHSYFNGTTRAIASAIRSAEESAAGGTVDTTPPAAPSGLSLTSAVDQQPDGTQAPYLLAQWSANVEADLNSYELQIDRAKIGAPVFVASASGTGGTLPAGNYAVVVTGVGSVSGETIRSSPQQVAITAGQRLFVNITAMTGMSSYKIYASILVGGEEVPKFWNTTATTGSAVEVTTAGSGAYPPASGTAVDFLNPQVIRTATTRVTIQPVMGGVYYVARVRAEDHSGNKSGFSTVSGTTAAPDTTAPPAPLGLAAIAGRVDIVGLSWQRVAVPDLAKYQYRYAQATPVEWSAPEDTYDTYVVVNGLTTEVLHYFQVRAVDLSGNVSAWTGTGVGVDVYVTATPGLITGNDIAAGSIIAEHISTTGLDASSIKTGTLTVGGVPNAPDFFIVVNSSGVEIGRWDQNGLLIKDPVNTLNQIRIINGIISFSSDGGVTWTTAISGAGITADSIKLGISPGGHNMIPNASFELSAFATTLQRLWDVAADWGASIAASDVNVTKTGSALVMTTVTY
jgi:hypothetical protein